jgi:hypothetical protein
MRDEKMPSPSFLIPHPSTEELDMSIWQQKIRAKARLSLEQLESRLVPTVATFAEAGTVFNDATRALEGGLWQNAVQESNQGLGSVFRYVYDMTTVQSDLQAEIAAHSFTGAAADHVNRILDEIATAKQAATASVNSGAAFGSVVAAENALRDAHLDILDIVQRDDTLADLASAGGAAGFQQVPELLDEVSTRTAPHANLAEIGAIFNDAANRILGGVNHANKDAITDDVKAVIRDLRELIDHNPAFSGLSGIHAQVIVGQLRLELTNINQAGTNLDAGRASNDVFLDVIDIVQGDPNLAKMANQGGIAGFAAFPSPLYPSTRYLDNQAQTSFIAKVVAQSHALGQAAESLVNQTPHDTTAIAALIAQLRTFQASVTDFQAAQPGIFRARFDNELLGHNSTLGTTIAAMIRGLRTSNQALVVAAAEELQTNAADVNGNNIPAPLIV